MKGGNGASNVIRFPLTTAKANRICSCRNVTDILMVAFAEYLREDRLQEQINALKAQVAALEEKTKSL